MRYKYPRTYHLPWSEGFTSDDKVLDSVSHFEGKKVVVTTKMDGENTTIYNNYVHARSMDSKSHPSRSWVKDFASCFQSEIPENFRICGENLYAKHSIHYHHLKSYFYMFSIWENEKSLNWKEVEVWSELLGIALVPVLYIGFWNEKLIKSLYNPKPKNGDEMEGYVVRLYDEFLMKDFNKSVAKFVRKNHVNTDKHWFFSTIVKNGLN